MSKSLPDESIKGSSGELLLCPAVVANGADTQSRDLGFCGALLVVCHAVRLSKRLKVGRVGQGTWSDS